MVKESLPDYLQEILGILEGGEFGDTSGYKPIREDDNLLGELNPLEKALLIFETKMRKSAIELIDQGAPQEDGAVQALFRPMEIASSMFMHSLAGRFGAADGDNFTIRQGWQVVHPAKKQCMCIGCQLKRGLEERFAKSGHEVNVTVVGCDHVTED